MSHFTCIQFSVARFMWNKTFETGLSTIYLFIHMRYLHRQVQLSPSRFKMKARETNESASTSVNYTLNKWKIKSIQAYRTFNQSIIFSSVFFSTYVFNAVNPVFSWPRGIYSQELAIKKVYYFNVISFCSTKRWQSSIPDKTQMYLTVIQNCCSSRLKSILYPIHLYLVE